MKEFTDNLIKYKNNILSDKTNDINIFPRYKTFKEIKENIVSRSSYLNGKKYDIYCFLFNSKGLFKPEDNYIFEKEGKETEELINIIIDIYNDEVKNFYKLLVDKEKLELLKKMEEEDKNIKKEEKKNKDKKKKGKEKQPKKKKIYRYR